MFEVTSAKFCESVGKDTLHPVPNYDQAHNCKLYSIVYKKKHSLHGIQYEHPGISILDLLKPAHKKEEVTLPTVEKSKILKWDQYYKFKFSEKLDGFLGALMALFKGQICTKDSVVVKIDFKQVGKKEVNLEKLLELLKNSKLDLNHDLVRQVKHEHIVLCLIYGVWSTTEESTISTGIYTEVDGQAGVAFDQEEVDPEKRKHLKDVDDLDARSEMTYAKIQKKSMTIPEDVPLAYETHELIVDPEGNMTLAMGMNTEGKFIKHLISEKGGY